MPTKEQFESAIFKGLMNACEDAVHFSGHISAKIRPEYVVTVNVAKALFEIDYSGYGSNFTVRFEEKTAKFATACVPHSNGRDIFNLINSRYNTKRNGRIDIAVYDESGQRPICPIEVKDFEPSKLELALDLERNIQFLRVNDIHAELSTVEFAFLASLEEHKNCVNKGSKDFGLRSLETRYRKMLADIIADNNDIIITITARTVAEDLLEDSFDHTKEGMDDYDFAEMVAEKYHYVGIIITAERLVPVTSSTGSDL